MLRILGKFNSNILFCEKSHEVDDVAKNKIHTGCDVGHIKTVALNFYFTFKKIVMVKYNILPYLQTIIAAAEASIPRMRFSIRSNKWEQRKDWKVRERFI